MFTPPERRRNRRSCRFSTAILNIPHEMENLAVRNAHTPAYRRSGLKREHGAPQVLSRSSVPRATLHNLSWAVFGRAPIFCVVRGIISAQCKHSPQPAAAKAKANMRFARMQQVARKEPGLLSLRMHGDEKILSSANTQANVAATNTAKATKGPCNPPAQRRVALLEHKWERSR